MLGGLAVRAARLGVARPVAVRSRGMAAGASPVYTAIMSSNWRYVTFIIAGAATTEFVFNQGMDFLWGVNNRNKLYSNVDWSTFKSIYADEEAAAAEE
jgi:hypothetical protein